MVDKDITICVECNENVVFFYRSYLCKECIRNFFNEPKASEGEDDYGHKAIIRNTKETR